MTRIKKKYQGHSFYRTKDPMDQLEHRFASQWQVINEAGQRGRGYHDPDIVDYMVGDGGLQCITEATDEERKIANTVVQWLGSPVGFGWLMDTLGLDGLRTQSELESIIKIWLERRW